MSKLPVDILSLILTYATEPLYSLGFPCDPQYRNQIMGYQMNNPKAFRWLKKHWANIINKADALKNPHQKIIELFRGAHITPGLLFDILPNPSLFDLYKDYPELIKHSGKIKMVCEFCPSYEFIQKMRQGLNAHGYIRALAKNAHCFKLEDITRSAIGYKEMLKNPSNEAIDLIETKFSKYVNDVKNSSDYGIDFENEIIENILTNKNPRAFNLAIRFINAPNEEGFIKEIKNKGLLHNLLKSPGAVDLIGRHIDEIFLDDIDRYGVFLRNNPNSDKIFGLLTRKLKDVISSNTFAIDYLQYIGSFADIDKYDLPSGLKDQIIRWKSSLYINGQPMNKETREYGHNRANIDFFRNTSNKNILLDIYKLRFPRKLAYIYLIKVEWNII